MERGLPGESEQSRQLQCLQEIQCTCHIKGESGLLWGNGKDQVASVARQAPRPHQVLCGLSHPTYSQRTGAGQGCPLGVAQKGAQDIPLQFSLLLHVGLWRCYGQSAKSPWNYCKAILEIVLFSLELITNPLTQLIKPLKMFSFSFLYMCIYTYVYLFSK